MPSEMVERVALRLGSWLRPGLDAHYVARAAIAAMREPTEAMMEAGGNCGGFEFDGDSGTIWPQPIWRAMMDAALAEEPT